MIRSLGLRNFKCFAELDLELRPLTLLAGVNGAGKSTVLQALLALAQSTRSNLNLNGEFVQIGTATDALFRSATTDEIQIHLNNRVLSYKRRTPGDAVLDGTSPKSDDTVIASQHFHLNNWEYLNCERLGPRPSYPDPTTSPFGDRHLHYFGPGTPHRQVGTRGERTARRLADAVTQRTLIDEVRRHPDAVAADLLSQLNAYLGDLFPGAYLEPLSVPEMDLVRISVGTRAPGSVEQVFRPTNVGFGISYAWHVLVAGLTLPESSLLMVENPEAHLHPRGQSRMGRFLGRIAKAGVQVLAETHSDHLLNGIRLMVHRSELDPGDVAIHYFSREAGPNGFEHRVVSPKIDRDGRLDQWPDGFFDEWDNALQTLLFPPEARDGFDPQRAEP